MGFDALFFARIDYQDKEKRKADKSLEFIWKPTDDALRLDDHIFTHVFYEHYSAPPNFDFDTEIIWQP